MRIRAGVVLGVLLAAFAAGCGAPADDGVATAGGKPKPSGSAARDAGDERELAMKFARCMRANGVPDFPDPEFDDDGGFAVRLPEGVDKKKGDEAHRKCRKYAPNGGEPPKVDPEMMTKLRAYAKCMRENGVPKFPDPTAEGLQLDSEKLGMQPDDPRFKAAEKACAKLMPRPQMGGPGPTTDSEGN